MGTSLVKLITEYPNTLRKTLVEQARLQRVIEELDAELDPDIAVNEDADADREIYKTNFERSRKVVRLETKIEKCKIKLREAEGRASQSHRHLYPKATMATMSAAEDTDEDVIEIRTELANLNEERKLIEIDANEGEWIRRNEPRTPAIIIPSDKDLTKQEKQLEKARLDLEKVEADVTALEAQFEGYKLLVAMGVTEI
jgi:hypothetical protein